MNYTKIHYFGKLKILGSTYSYGHHTQKLFCQNLIKSFLRPFTQAPCVHKSTKVTNTIVCSDDLTLVPHIALPALPVVPQHWPCSAIPSLSTMPAVAQPCHSTSPPHHGHLPPLTSSRAHRVQYTCLAPLSPTLPAPTKEEPCSPRTSSRPRRSGMPQSAWTPWRTPTVRHPSPSTETAPRPLLSLTWPLVVHQSPRHPRLDAGAL